MELNEAKEAALLSWINSVNPDEPVTKLTQMMDEHRLLKFAFKMHGKGPCDGELLSVCPNEMEVIFTLLQDDFQFIPRQSSLLLQKIEQRMDLEIQLAKVVLVLCYCGLKKHNLPPLDTKTEVIIASMLQFIQDDADGLSLDKGLDKFLTRSSVMTFSTSSSESGSPLYIHDESPIISRFQNHPRVQFQELFTVACDLASSPVQDVMSTPHFQLKKLRKELAHEGDVRDELEKELADQISIISEKEGLISQLQHRVERLLREQGELDKEHKAALLELQEKNESLLHRVHEVLKQCQDLKTDNSQKEKKIDELTEENGTLTAQVRNVFAQLARTEEEVAKLTLAHESAQAEWKNRKEFLEKELNEAVTHRECLSEQVQILQGKISVLEDELKKAQFQERGEVLGSSMLAFIKIETLQTQIQNLSKQIALKDEEISNLRNEYDSVDHELKLVKEQNTEIKEKMESTLKEHEDTVKKLQQELLSAALAASEKQEEMLVLSAEVTSLKEQICRYSENEAQKQQEMSVLKENLISVQHLLAAAKQFELQQELRHQETLKEKSQELEKIMGKLQTKTSALSSEKDAQISALKAEMKAHQLRSERLELKVEKQNSSILALKNVARQFEQQNKELVRKLDVMLKQLQHYGTKNQEAQEMNRSLEKSLQASRREVKALQMDRELAMAKVCFAERRLKEQRNRSDDREDVRHMSLRVPQKRQDSSIDVLEFDLGTSFNTNAEITDVIRVENESDHASDDWMRIAELQARNKACLPHLKSSYSLESGPVVGLPSFTLTDEDLRMGDPKETIRRAALHLQESQMSCTPQARKHRGSQLQDLNTSERKQRQSLMFTIANTPKRHKSGSLLQRGLKRHKDSCKNTTVLSHALRPADGSANSRSQKSPIRKCPRSVCPNTCNAKKGAQEK